MSVRAERKSTACRDITSNSSKHVPALTEVGVVVELSAGINLTTRLSTPLFSSAGCETICLSSLNSILEYQVANQVEQERVCLDNRAPEAQKPRLSLHRLFIADWI